MYRAKSMHRPIAAPPFLAADYSADAASCRECRLQKR
jgi:hypothetical protein